MSAESAGPAARSGTAALYDALRAFESRHAAFDLTLAGAPVWEMTRYPVFCAVATERGLWGRGDGERTPRRGPESARRCASG